MDYGCRWPPDGERRDLRGRMKGEARRWGGVIANDGSIRVCHVLPAPATFDLRRFLRHLLLKTRYLAAKQQFGTALLGELSHSGKEWQAEAGGGKTFCLSAFLEVMGLGGFLICHALPPPASIQSATFHATFYATVQKRTLTATTGQKDSNLEGQLHDGSAQREGRARVVTEPDRRLAGRCPEDQGDGTAREGKSERGGRGDPR